MPSSIISADDHTVPSVSVIYFVSVSNPDSHKDGVEYRMVTGSVRKIDLYQRILTLDDKAGYSDSSGSANGTTVHIDDVVQLDEDIFVEYE